MNGQLFGQTYIYDEVDPDVASLAIQPIQEHDHQNKEQSELGLTYDKSFGPKLSTETLFIQQFQGEDYLTLYSETGDVGVLPRRPHQRREHPALHRHLHLFQGPDPRGGRARAITISCSVTPPMW